MKRNLDRFPEDFAFHLTKEEFDDLRSQTGISSWGERRYAPYAFTEQGVAMLSRHPSQQDRRTGKCGDHAYLRPAPPDAGDQ